MNLLPGAVETVSICDLAVSRRAAGRGESNTMLIAACLGGTASPSAPECYCQTFAHVLLPYSFGLYTSGQYRLAPNYLLTLP
jgi:hypothetical protein